MRCRDAPSQPALGFLTVVAHEQHGWFGGYLVLNQSGRPLEFHCTAPVKPNRAQEILYGPTLEPFLYGEQIGRTLVEKSVVEARLICTDLPAVMAVREHVSPPVALILPPDAAESPGGAASGQNNPGGDTLVYRLDATHALRTAPFSLGRNRLAVANGYEDDRQLIAKALEALADHFDLSEPFARIRGAIDEAQRGRG